MPNICKALFSHATLVYLLRLSRRFAYYRIIHAFIICVVPVLNHKRLLSSKQTFVCKGKQTSWLVVHKQHQIDVILSKRSLKAPSFSR